MRIPYRIMMACIVLLQSSRTHALAIILLNLASNHCAECCYRSSLVRGEQILPAGGIGGPRRLFDGSPVEG